LPSTARRMAIENPGDRAQFVPPSSLARLSGSTCSTRSSMCGCRSIH
jgi:hypothetical protein